MEHLVAKIKADCENYNVDLTEKEILERIYNDAYLDVIQQIWNEFWDVQKDYFRAKVKQQFEHLLIARWGPDRIEELKAHPERLMTNTFMEVELTYAPFVDPLQDHDDFQSMCLPQRAIVDDDTEIAEA